MEKAGKSAERMNIHISIITVPAIRTFGRCGRRAGGRRCESHLEFRAIHLNDLPAGSRAGSRMRITKPVSLAALSKNISTEADKDAVRGMVF